MKDRSKDNEENDNDRYLRGEIGGDIKSPITKVRKRRGMRIGEETRAIGMWTRLWSLDVIGGWHTGEEVLIGWPTGDGVGDAAAPLEEESEGGEGEGEDG